MRFVITTDRPYIDRPDPVRALLCRWHRFALMSLQRDQGNKYQWDVTDPTRGIIIPATNDIAALYRKAITQIPIVLLRTMTAWLRPAVSSLEACQTPAH